MNEQRDVAYLSEALKTNTTLIVLDLWGEEKDTKDAHKQTSQFFSLRIDRIRDWIYRSNVIE